MKTMTEGLLWACCAIIIWSGSLVLLRLGVTTSLNAYDLTFLRFGTAALILAPSAFLSRGEQMNHGWWSKLGMVVMFGAPYIVLMSFGMQTAPAAAAGTLNPGVMAVTSVLLGAFIFGDAFGTMRLIGLLVTIMAIFVFSSTGDGATPGHAILVITGTMWALYTVIIRRERVPSLDATRIVAIGSAVLFIPAYVVFLPKNIGDAPIYDIASQALFQGVLVSVLAVYAFNRSIECLGPIAGAVLPALIPIVTVLLGIVVLGETVGPLELGTVLLLTIGVVLILIRPSVSAVEQED